MNVLTALIVDIIATVLVVVILLLLSKAMRIQPKTQSKMKRELFQSGDTLPPKPRRIYIDTYVFIAFFVMFDVSVFVLATLFFVNSQQLVGGLMYAAILFLTVLVGIKKRFARDVIEPITTEELEGGNH